MLTVGVEEEFLLLEPSGAPAPRAADLVRLTGSDGRIVPEFMAYQVETVTPVCRRLDDLHTNLVRLRLRAARGAERLGVHLVSTGAAPFAAGPVGALTDNPRYRELARRFPDAAAGGGTCACQVHVGIPDRDLAVDVLARLRPWLPMLLALNVNSPLVRGADGGWSSNRYRVQLRWPTFRPPQVWAGAERYDRAVRSLIARGAAMDQGSVYFLARLSARYPTVEVRVADAGLTVEDSLLFAGVVRGLVASLIDDSRRGRPVAPLSRARLSAALLAVAHHGPAMRGSARRDPAAARAAIADRLLAKIAPALDETGDTDEVRAGLDRLSRLGTGADRQRDLWARTRSARPFVAALAEATLRVPEWATSRWSERAG